MPYHLAKEIDEIDQRQRARAGVLEGDVDDLDHRNDQENEQEQAEQQGQAARPPLAARK